MTLLILCRSLIWHYRRYVALGCYFTIGVELLWCYRRYDAIRRYVVVFLSVSRTKNKKFKFLILSLMILYPSNTIVTKY